ncbi:RagB/SusD family nutrient uptake outer membrane protein [Arachidicoccus terrestris]|uniref:RagB/SusD family nutrient uptake outer membrane protein n=1 Tax=Arachidicoccus terrestris TaxID=2875539 RepID=UPI001CC7D4F9|nr:RagB/SusD family nutrient uptake outer membrane protein [Arachidicoccus terrestris]UAY56964.1 RagB/SusD family nutrient uptake outer membrane protein [Arachidicoccus terrestris]
MKYSIIIIGAFFLAGSLSGCSKFLEESPKSITPVDAYFTSVSQAESAVNYLYGKGTGPGRFFNIGGLYDGTNSFTLDNLSGMANNTVAQDPSVRYFASLTQTVGNSSNYLGGVWSSFYSSIASANTIIDKVSNSNTIEQSAKAPLIATARFFRAIDYYYLVRLFGAVPLILKPYTSLENLYAPRASVDSVYASIVDDLNWAIEKGNLADKPMGSNGNRISKGTAEVVLAEVYLTMAGYPLQKGADSYTKALKTAKNLIASPGGYSLFTSEGKVTAFDKLRLTSYDQGSEYLYFIEYNANIQGSAYPEYTLPNSFPVPIPNANIKVQYTLMTTPWTPSTTLLSLYDSTSDIRRHNRQFYHNSFTYTDKSGKLRTIGIPTLPFRWFDSTAIFETGASGKYVAVYRMADIYLIAAEAANALGQDPSPYLDPILNRAYVHKPAIPAGQTARRDLILAERYRELAMEGHFWFDMTRTRLYPDVGAGHKVSFSALVGHDNGRGQKFQEKDLLMPIPSTEMQRNPALKPQNPGY